MNPSLKAERLERERRLDPLRFAREYEAKFAEDLESFLPSVSVEDAVVPGRYELPPREDVEYFAAVDPSGGGPDAFTFSICHIEEERVIQDAMKGWSRKGSHTVDLEGIVREIAEMLRAYGITSITGDKYAGQLVRQAFAREGIEYLEAKEKSQAYLELEVLFAQGQIELLAGC